MMDSDEAWKQEISSSIISSDSRRRKTRAFMVPLINGDLTLLKSAALHLSQSCS